MNEELFRCGSDDAAIGVWTPAASPSSTAVVLLASRELHRVGPHRMYVHIARRLAQRGIGAARFDYRAQGYSPDALELGHLDQNAKEVLVLEDTRAVLDHLEHEYGIERFILAGNCAGAFLAFKTGALDDRVIGVSAINTPIELCTEDPVLITGLETQRRSTQLGRGSLKDPQRWKRLLTGKTSWKRIASALGNRLRRPKLPGVTTTPDAAPSDVGPLDILPALQHLCQLGKRVCLTFSQDELVLAYLQQIVGLDRLRELRPHLELYSLPNVDHLVIQRYAFERFVDDQVAWLYNVLQPENCEPGRGTSEPPFRNAVDVLS